LRTLITDIDGTLIGDRPGLKAFNEFIRANRNYIRLVYATGRDMREYENALKDEGLLLPEAMILDTGADIFVKKQGVYISEGGWHSKISGPSWDIKKAAGILSGLEYLSPQNKENPYKLSYCAALDDEKRVTAEIDGLLKDGGIEAEVIASHGCYIDVLPKGCDKGMAALYLMEKLKIGRDEVIVAGDSENDADLFEAFEKGVLVGNARHGLKKSVEGMGFYEAKADCASGVLEGLKYYIERENL